MKILLKIVSCLWTVWKCYSLQTLRSSEFAVTPWRISCHLKCTFPNWWQKSYRAIGSSACSTDRSTATHSFSVGHILQGHKDLVGVLLGCIKRYHHLSWLQIVVSLERWNFFFVMAWGIFRWLVKVGIWEIHNPSDFFQPLCTTVQHGVSSWKSWWSCSLALNSKKQTASEVYFLFY